MIGFAAAAEYSKSHLASNRKIRKNVPNLAPFHQKPSRNTFGYLYSSTESKNVKHNCNSSAESGQKSTNSRIPEPIFLGNPKHQLANFVPVCFPGLDAERLIYKLEAEGILVSTGAACAANKGTKSHVLAAIGLSDEEIAGSLRISLGSTNTEEQIAEAAKKITETIRQEYCRKPGDTYV